MDGKSKPLGKAETSAARLCKAAMEGRPSFGMDIDLIFRTCSGYAVLEFLRCESAKATPATSHPRRYWDMNWRKFRRLWEITRDLHGRQCLVNYEERTEGVFGRFRIMEVLMGIEPSEHRPVQTVDIDSDCDFAGFQAWFQRLQREASMVMDES